MRGSAGAAKLFVGTGASGPAAVVPGVDTGNGDAGDIVGVIAGGVAGTGFGLVFDRISHSATNRLGTQLTHASAG